MEKVKITKVDVKESGMFVVGFTSGFGDEGEATGNIKWQAKECEYLKNSIDQIVSIETKQNGQYCNITKVDMKARLTTEGDEAYAKHAMPITESEKVDEYQRAKDELAQDIVRVKNDTKKANVNPGLMSVKDIQIISQCLTKCVAQMSQTSTMSPNEKTQYILDTYRFFVLELEENG